MGDVWGQVEQNESEKAYKSDPVHELFYVWYPDLSDKVLFEQSPEASEKANHVVILQKFILGRECTKCKDLLEARLEGGSIQYLRSRKEASVTRLA